MKVLAVGDIHLGRRPSRLPEELHGRAGDLGPAGAWSRVVDAAIRERVSAVALAGDVVERENDFFEAYRELHQGVARLARARIAVLGVTGNHDVQALPRLADEISAFQLLGRNGQWEGVRIEDQGECLTLWGWSFPQARVKVSPLSGAGPERHSGLSLGLLHCDRDQTDSSYAPVTSRELQMAGLDGWLLGHIHRPDELAASKLAGYLGSVTGMDPGEAGPHGPWLLAIAGGRIREVVQWSLAPLRWESLQVDLAGIAGAAEARSRVLGALRELDTRLSAKTWMPEAVGLRVSFFGKSRFGEEAVALFSPEERGHLYNGVRGTHYFIERLETTTEPEISIEALARRTDPAGLLARRLLLLDRPAVDAERQILLADARRRLEMQHREVRWSGLQLEDLDDEEVAGWLRRSGGRLMERLLAQWETKS